METPRIEAVITGAPFTGEEKMALYAFDGTGQDADEQRGDEWTNVKAFRDRYRGASERFYASGPGTRGGPIGKVLGGFAGIGADVRVKEAFACLRRAFESGDRVVDIVGYSRGAAAALVFSWVLSSRRARKVLGESPSIRFLGLWDAVFYIMPTVGMPFAQRLRVQMTGNKLFGPLPFRGPNSLDLQLPPIVQNAFHALALHERRRLFTPMRISGAHEVWFAGGHADVGGGSENMQLSEASLTWMLEKARACGVPVRFLQGSSATQGAEDLRCPLNWSDWVRDIRGEDTIHASVLQYGGESVKRLARLRVEASDSH